MNDDFSTFESMRDSGVSPEQAYLNARNIGIDTITGIRMIRAVFSLSPREAKEVMLRSDNSATSVAENQERIANRIGV